MRRVLLIGCLAAVSQGLADIDLSGTWRLARTDDPSVACPIEVPGDVQSALLKAKLMPDPFWGRNELKVQDVGRKDWTVSRTFEVDDETFAKKALVLRLEDVDTFATVSLNGHELGKTDNRFRRWEFDVKPHLKKGVNELKAVFASAENRGHEIARAYDHRFPMGNSHWATDQALVRKPACHAGWDWGLALMSTGFCGETRILAYDDCKVDYVRSSQEFNTDLSHCDFTVWVDATDADGRAFTVTNRFPIDNPPLWWPNGAGERRFYEYTVKVGSHELTRKVGLRKIEVLTPMAKGPKDKEYPGLAFRVNGRTLFMKGVNWIPCSAFENEQTTARYRDLLTSAAAANMNMVRLWGGGQFEKDCFYDLCDELGLLVWHDFMFACGPYPGDERFLSSVRAEARHQVRRLAEHASIALWSGDNECIGSLDWYKECLKDMPYYVKAQDAGHAVCEAAVREFDPQRTFWTGSPCAGPGGSRADWNAEYTGDRHSWEVWGSGEMPEQYRTERPRFCSEFGFQSFSSREVAETFCRPEDVNPSSPDFEWHQKHKKGNKLVVEALVEYFRFPRDIDAMLYLSQAMQAVAIKTGVECWRAQRPNCMGTLYWQLNDNWPVASWSSIEYGGKWKQLHYHMRRLYAPLAVMGLADDRIAAVNDTAEPVDATVDVERWSFDGRILGSKTVAATLPADGVFTWKGDEAIPADVGEPSFLAMTLRTASGTYQNEWFFGRYKQYDLANAKVRVSVDGFRVTLTTDAPAFFVWANVKGVPGEFSDNSFTLLPSRPKEIDFTPKGEVSADTFEQALSVMHLRQSY